MRFGSWNIMLFWMLSVLFAVLLAACGGGGGGGGDGGSSPAAQVVSGTASNGAAFSGLVVLKDARGKQLSMNTTTGAFTFDVTNLAVPFILKAGTLYSVATAAGTTNINPFTHVIAKSAAGSSIDLDTVFANVSSNRTKLTNISTNLPQALTNFNVAMNQKDTFGTSIYSKYGLTSPPDFQHGKITIDHDVDKLFADINVSVTGSTVTVTNKSGATLMSGNYSVSGSTVSYNFTYNFTNIGGLNGSVTITQTGCKAGYVGATETYNIPGVTVCSPMTYCVSTTNPTGNAYYIIKGHTITVDMAQILASNINYYNQLGSQILAACQ
jgi:hypothetical protein